MPQVAIIGGPNGAGKTTLAPRLLFEYLSIRKFVNADIIASGLSVFEPDVKALEAGRYMLDQVKQLAAARENFGFETTLASRTFAPWLDGVIEQGYEFNLIFLWLPTPDDAVQRVAQRVARGGHHVPEDVIQRRYERGLANFFALYQPRAHYWQMYNGVTVRVIAEGMQNSIEDVHDSETWNEICRTYRP